MSYLFKIGMFLKAKEGIEDFIRFSKELVVGKSPMKNWKMAMSVG